MARTTRNWKAAWPSRPPIVQPSPLTPSACTANLSTLFFATDAVAKSSPLLLNCPTNIVATCGAPVVYGPVTYGACGDVTITYNPPAGTSFPVGTTPVQVTLADQH